MASGPAKRSSRSAPLRAGLEFVAQGNASAPAAMPLVNGIEIVRE